MEILTDIEQVTLAPTCVAIGVFDGVHVGHQAVLRRAAAGAREAGLLAAALTFDPHPDHVLRPHRAPLLLTTVPERAAVIAEFGIEVMVIARFDRALANMTPEQFCHRVLAQRLAARCVVAGEGFVFGRGASGDIATLVELGPQFGFSAAAVKRVTVDGAEVSSTAIRQLVAAGEVERAAPLLGRDYSIRGSVVRGEQRGRVLGIPTANICVDEHKLLPRNGVYAARARLEDEALPAVANIGVRPTFAGAAHGHSASPTCVEAHIIDASPPDAPYGRTLTLDVVGRLRDETAFPSPEALAQQIRRDIARAREMLSAG